MRRLRDESGFVGGMEAMPFGFLVFVVGTLLLVNAWGVFDSHLAAGAAAREAVRAFVESSEAAPDAEREARQVADEALEGHGKDVARRRVSFSPDPPVLERCQAITVTVEYDVPLIAVPWVGAFGSGLITTSARHTEIVDPYRSGLDTDAFVPEDCSA